MKKLSDFIVKHKGLVAILLVIVLLALDQWLKIWVKTHMTIGEAIPIFGNWFYIQFLENLGAAFGMELGGDYGKLILSIFRLIAFGALAWFIRHLILRDRKARAEGVPERRVNTGVIVGFTLILAGAVGNMIDSFFYGLIFSESTMTEIAELVPWGEGYGTFMHGAVVDMLHFPIIQIEQMPDWVPIWGGEEFTFFSPIFNLADSYVTCGVLYLAIFQYKFFK